MIEGTEERKSGGELVIDVAEYGSGADGLSIIHYFQLKHTSVRNDTVFTLSDFEKTLNGFALRFAEHRKLKKNKPQFSFHVITNRPISKTFKENIRSIAKKQFVSNGFLTTLKRYTGFSPATLTAFCKLLHFEDSEGNYAVQREDLRLELGLLVADPVQNDRIELLTALVREKIMPGEDKTVRREDVLKVFGVTNENQLFPAVPRWEPKGEIVNRTQYLEILERIQSVAGPVIVHAEGGVGKSFFASAIPEMLNDGSVGIAYDCFGAGSYRNRSDSRHTHEDAFLQIVNELSVQGLCNPLLPSTNTSKKDLTRRLIDSLHTSIRALKAINSHALLFIIIDAADNAEMAAQDLAQDCFAHEFLREPLPADCKLVMFCRTERIDLLQPTSNVLQFELTPFELSESFQHLKNHYPEATILQGEEFHSLTFKNPRVQAYALSKSFANLPLLLQSLGPSGITVEQQIESQLISVVTKTKDGLPKADQKQFDAICAGLAALPPHIPIEVLATISHLPSSAVRSFASDIGRSIWISESTLQFRDEPSETWFRNTFASDKDQYSDYIKLLEPLSSTWSYVASVLPQLYLKAEQHDKLIRIALSDEYLPLNNPVDARNVRLFRLQFAFQAAVRISSFADAAKLALRAGEEVAGNQRQTQLFRSNIDLLIAIQSEERIQELAFKRTLRGSWEGSENIYSASLLSGKKAFHGEAMAFLRSSMNWLRIYFNSRNNEKTSYEENLTDGDILELAYAHFNLLGVKECIQFLQRLSPVETIFGIVSELTRRFIDEGNQDHAFTLFTHTIDNSYLGIAASSVLSMAGIPLEREELGKLLQILEDPQTRIPKANLSERSAIRSAIVSFLEACVRSQLPKNKVLAVLNFYTDKRASKAIGNFYQQVERSIFLRAVSLKTHLENNSQIQIEDVLPIEFTEKVKYDDQSEITEFKNIVESLFPWYLLRTRAIESGNLSLSEAVNTAGFDFNKRESHIRSNRGVGEEITSVCVSILKYNLHGSSHDLLTFYQTTLENNGAFNLENKLSLLSSSCRLQHLAFLRNSLERDAYNFIKERSGKNQVESSTEYIDLARAVLSSRTEASIYFDTAVEMTDKLGDDLLLRWEALVWLADKADSNTADVNILAYRFLRCAEFVGENAREKHWHRGGALITGARLSAGMSIATLSRWRDRGVGRFHYELQDLVGYLVASNLLSPTTGWPFSRFCQGDNLENFLKICMSSASHEERHEIFRDALNQLQTDGCSHAQILKMKELASEFQIDFTNFDIAQVSGTILTRKTNKTHKSSPSNSLSAKIFDRLLEGVDFSSNEGVKEVLRKWRLEANQKKSGTLGAVLKQLLIRSGEDKMFQFLEFVFDQPEVEYFNAEQLLSHIPEGWKVRPTFQILYPGLIEKFAEKYWNDLVSEYSFDATVKQLALDDDLIVRFKAGILSGFKNNNDLSDPRLLFGFVKLVLHKIADTDVTPLLEYALGRFELHLEPQFGDGIWHEKLDAGPIIEQNLAGLLWSAFGAPHAEDRWKAAHCVKVCAEFREVGLLNELVQFLETTQGRAFSDANYVFYDYHARQYLLMVFARISKEHADLLRPHAEIFKAFALKTEHFLIQYYAAVTSINIESTFSGTYSPETLSLLESVAQPRKARLPVKSKSRVSRSNDDLAESESLMKFNFGWDIERYWYQPAGEVFGLTGDAFERLAAEVISLEWKMNHLNGYMQNPRRESHAHSYQDIAHDHGRYPRTDSMDFYLSFHAMFVVVARLLKTHEIYNRHNWDNSDPWQSWLAEHLLTRKDGKWLSEAKDAVPIKRPEWVGTEVKENWVKNIHDGDYLKNILETICGEQWITVDGQWHERDDPRMESLTVSAALVSKEASNSLLSALSTCSDSNDFKLPEYEEEAMEFESGAFQLKGFIKQNRLIRGRDEFDPYADGVNYPPFQFGQKFLDQFNLIEVDDSKRVINLNTNRVEAFNEIWSSYKERRDDEHSQRGIRLKARATLLTEICAASDCDLIIEIGIERQLSYRSDNSDRQRNEPPHKIFLFSADGKLRNTEGSY